MTHTNFRDVEKVLLTKESIQQTLRFLLAGAYQHDEPGITAVIKEIHSLCPTLLDDLLPFSESARSDEEEAGRSAISIIADELHRKPVAIGCIQKHVQLLRFPIWPGRISMGDPFNKSLYKAYELDYSEPNVSFPREIPMRWCQKFAFTDRYIFHTSSKIPSHCHCPMCIPFTLHIPP